MDEVWKDIKDYEGYYQISNLGNVRSLDRWVNKNGTLAFQQGCQLKPLKQSSGYLQAGFYINGKYKKRRIEFEQFSSKNIPPKEILEQQLLECKNFVEVGKRYEVTDNAVRRWCRKYGLPDHTSQLKKLS